MLISIAVLVTACISLSSSLTQDCSTVRKPCTQKQIEEQNKNYPPCTSGINYFNCLARSLDDAEASGQCGQLALSTYRSNAFQEAGVYAANCQGFEIPSSFMLDDCQKEIASCGGSSLDAFVAFNNNDNVKKCSDLEKFKSCMETNTRSCSNRQSVTDVLQTELTDYIYQDTCFPSLSQECSAVRRPCNAQQSEDQKKNIPPCTVGASYFTCLATALTSADQRGVCSRLPLLTYRLDSFKEAQSYAANCPDFEIPSSLQLDGCDRELAVCGGSALKVFVANNNNDALEKCSNLEAFKSCMDSNTQACLDRKAVDKMLQQDLIYYQYQATCIDTTTTDPPTTTTITTTPKTTTRRPTPRPGGNYGNGGNKVPAGNSSDQIRPLLITVGLALLAWVL